MSQKLKLCKILLTLNFMYIYIAFEKLQSLNKVIFSKIAYTLFQQAFGIKFNTFHLKIDVIS
jgi:hypothetical protein